MESAQVFLQGKNFATKESGSKLASPDSKTVVIQSWNSATAAGGANFLVVPLGTFQLQQQGLIKRVSFSCNFISNAAALLQVPGNATFAIQGLTPFYVPPVAALFNTNSFFWNKADSEGQAIADLQNSNLFIPAGVTVTLTTTLYRAVVLNDSAVSNCYLTIQFVN
jgi:hypothetical protein